MSSVKVLLHFQLLLFSYALGEPKATVTTLRAAKRADSLGGFDIFWLNGTSTAPVASAWSSGASVESIQSSSIASSMASIASSSVFGSGSTADATSAAPLPPALSTFATSSGAAVAPTSSTAQQIPLAASGSSSPFLLSLRSSQQGYRSTVTRAASSSGHTASTQDQSARAATLSTPASLTPTSFPIDSDTLSFSASGTASKAAPGFSAQPSTGASSTLQPPSVLASYDSSHDLVFSSPSLSSPASGSADSTGATEATSSASASTVAPSVLETTGAAQNASSSSSTALEAGASSTTFGAATSLSPEIVSTSAKLVPSDLLPSSNSNFSVPSSALFSTTGSTSLVPESLPQPQNVSVSDASFRSSPQAPLSPTSRESENVTFNQSEAVIGATYSTKDATYTTRIVTELTTYCPSPTTFVQNAKTYVVTSATTLTITDCPCTLVGLVSPTSAQPTSEVNTEVSTVVVSSYVTYCPEPTTFSEGTVVYTVTSPTLLTVTDCPCTRTVQKTASLSSADSSSPKGVSIFPALNQTVSSRAPTPGPQEETEPSTAPVAITMTAVVASYTTYCPSPTVFTHGTVTYVVTQPTMLTITDCPCTITSTTVLTSSPSQSLKPSSATPTFREVDLNTIHPTSSRPEPSPVTLLSTTVVSSYTTYCPSPTVFTHGTVTYAVTQPTVLTITDCPCTITSTTVLTSSPSQSSKPSSATPTFREVDLNTIHPTSSRPEPSPVTLLSTTVVSSYTTYCPSPTVFTHGTVTYVVTQPTMLTITDCPCVITSTTVSTPTITIPVGPTPQTIFSTIESTIQITRSVIPSPHAPEERLSSTPAMQAYDSITQSTSLLTPHSSSGRVPALIIPPYKPEILTTTQVVSSFTTYCPTPTVFTHGSSTYVITQPTLLIITDCPCTITTTTTSITSTASVPESQAPKQVPTVEQQDTHMPTVFISTLSYSLSTEIPMSESPGPISPTEQVPPSSQPIITPSESTLVLFTTITIKSLHLPHISAQESLHTSSPVGEVEIATTGSSVYSQPTLPGVVTPFVPSQPSGQRLQPTDVPIVNSASIKRHPLFTLMACILIPLLVQ